MTEPTEESDFVREIGMCFSPGGRLARNCPGFVSRPSQIAFAKIVARALENRETAVLEAGTGTGKTFAYLAPVLLSGRKAIVSTAGKTLQEQLFNKDFPALEAALGVHVTVKLLKGRSNYICLRRLKNVRQMGLPTKEAYEDLRIIERFAAVDLTGDRAGVEGVAEDSVIWPYVTSSRENCSAKKCPHAAECFVNKARQEAREAQVVVVNHHLFLSAASVREASDSRMLPDADIVIFDEAHKLADIGSYFFGEELSTSAVFDQLKDVRRITMSRHRHALGKDQSWEDLYAAARDALQDFVLKLDELSICESDSKNIASVKDIESAVPLLTEAYRAVETLTAHLEPLAQEDDDLNAPYGVLTEALDLMHHWEKALQSPENLVRNESGKPYVRWISRVGRDVRLCQTPLSFAQDFAAMMAQSPNTAWVFTSATLATGKSDFSHFLKELGLVGVFSQAWESPFDFPNQALLYIPRDMPSPAICDKSLFIERLVDESWPVIDLLQGRTLFLCTSRQAMRLAAERLRDRIQDNKRPYTVYVQNEDSRHNLLMRFRDNPQSVLVATMGFWEGIDIKGEGLSLVIIDKLPFAPKDDPVLEARCQWINAEGGNAFFSHQIPLAAILLKQGVGRLIRSETDRGILIVGDVRLIPGRSSYASQFMASLPDFVRTREISRVLDFWQHPDDWL